MSLIQRLGQAIRANVNNLLREAEDPEQLLQQALEQMRDHEMEVRAALAQAIATQKRNQRYIANYQSKANYFYHQAQLALSQGEENLARKALAQRQFYQDLAQNSQKQIEQHSGAISQLKQDLQILETKIAQAKAQKDLYIARARSAIAVQNIQQLTGNAPGGNLSNLFERMEEKVLELEANSELMQQQGQDEIEKKFIAWENSQKINSVLAEIKTGKNFLNKM